MSPIVILIVALEQQWDSVIGLSPKMRTRMAVLCTGWADEIRSSMVAVNEMSSNQWWVVGARRENGL